MTKSVRVLVVAVATFAGLVSWTDDAFGGPFRRNRGCPTCCVTTNTCCPTTMVSCPTACQQGGHSYVKVVRATPNCCGQVVPASAQAPAPMPLPATGQQSAPQAAAPAAPAAQAPVTVTGPSCTNCGTVTSASCTTCCVPATRGIRRVSYFASRNACCPTTCSTCGATTVTAAPAQPATVVSANCCDPCNDGCVVTCSTSRRLRLRR